MASPDPQLAALGQTIRFERRIRDLSQEALAARAGMHPAHLSEIERGVKDARTTTLLRLIAGLGLTPAAFFAAHETRRPVE